MRGSRRRGMTLLETVLSVAIIMVIGTIGWASVQGAVDISDALSLRDETVRAARATFSLIRRDLQLAYLTPNRVGLNNFQTVFVGKNDNPDKVWFASLAHQRLYRNARESDQTEISLWVERGDKAYDPGDVLYHSEAPRIDMQPDEGGRIYPLAYHVKSFDLRYLDGRFNEWTEEWDSRGADTPYILPRAVQVAIVLLAPDPKDPKRRSVDVPFFTTILTSYADPITPLVGMAPDAAQPQQAGAGF